MMSKNEERIAEIKDRMDEIVIEMSDLKECITAKEHERDAVEINPRDVEDQYCEMLDSDGAVTVCGLEFDPSRILRELDSIAYHCGLNDYVNGLDVSETDEYKELQDEIDDLEDELSDLECEQEDLKEELSDLVALVKEENE
jgi:chromosome segregation ATPase